jgi:hypothetical protein
MPDYIPPYLVAPNYERPDFSPCKDKPARGEAKHEHRARHAAADTREARNKTTVRKRDSHRSRWPGDDGQPLEVAHLTHKGIGGDMNTERSIPALMILVSRDVHQGPRSLTSGDLRIVFLTDEQANGPVAFLERVSRVGNVWREIRRELWPGTLAPEKDAR